MRRNTRLKYMIHTHLIHNVCVCFSILFIGDWSMVASIKADFTLSCKTEKGNETFYSTLLDKKYTNISSLYIKRK